MRYWFKRKRYGWGWTPSTWEGWTSMLVYVLIMTLAPSMLASNGAASLLLIIPLLTLSTAALIALCWWKGETPRWSWGDDDDQKDDHQKDDHSPK